MQKKVKQLQKECSIWEEKYNNLLQKNQNDLIKIRLREKNLNETIKKLEQQKQEIKVQFNKRIDHLEVQLRIQKLKNQQFQAKNKNLRNQNLQKSECKNETSLIYNLRQQNQSIKQRIAEFQASNLKHKMDKVSQGQKEVKNQQKKIQQSQGLDLKITDLQKKIIQLQNQKLSLNNLIKSYETQRKQQIQREKKASISNHERENEFKKKQQTVFCEVERLRELLKLTEIQYKNLLHKQELKEEIIHVKNDQLNQMTQQLINLQIQLQKASQFQIFKTKFVQQERKKQQLEQENMLIKQMLKSHKTMLKIKDNEIENLKKKCSF